MSLTPPSDQNFIARWLGKWRGAANTSAMEPVDGLDLRVLDHLEAASGGPETRRSRPAKQPSPKPVQAKTAEARLIACIQARDLKSLSLELANYPRDKANKEYGNTGWTPFQVACQSGWRDGIAALLPYGRFDDSVKGLDGHVAFALLAQHGFALLSEALALHGPTTMQFLKSRSVIQEALPTDEDQMLFAIWEQSCGSSKNLPLNEFKISGVSRKP